MKPQSFISFEADSAQSYLQWTAEGEMLNFQWKKKRNLFLYIHVYRNRYFMIFLFSSCCFSIENFFYKTKCLCKRSFLYMSFCRLIKTQQWDVYCVYTIIISVQTIISYLKIIKDLNRLFRQSFSLRLRRRELIKIELNLIEK